MGIGRKEVSGQVSPGKPLINGKGNLRTAFGQAKAKVRPESSLSRGEKEEKEEKEVIDFHGPSHHGSGQ